MGWLLGSLTRGWNLVETIHVRVTLKDEVAAEGCGVHDSRWVV